jgi:hypothetical protein
MNFLTARPMISGKAKVTSIGMEQGRVSRENVSASSQFKKEQILRRELNNLDYGVLRPGKRTTLITYCQASGRYIIPP